MPSGIVQWGTEKIPGVLKVESAPKPQNAIQTSLSREGSRIDRLGTRQAEFTTFEDGLGLHHVAETEENLRRLYYSDGLWSHIPNGLFLPPALTTAVVDSGHNISTYRGANKSAHYVVSTLGQSNPRLYVVVGNELYRATSDSNPALASAHSWTDAAYFAYEGVFNNTRYLVTGGGGDTNDVFGIANPVSAPTTTASLITLTNGDWVGGGAYMDLGGPKFNLFYGRIGGVDGLWFLFPNQALLTAPRPLVLAETRNEEGNIATVTLSELSPTEGSNNGVGTNVGWGRERSGWDALEEEWMDTRTLGGAREGVWVNPGNITASDTSDAQYFIRGDETANTEAGTEVFDITVMERDQTGITSGLVASFSALVPASAVLTGWAGRWRGKVSHSSVLASLADMTLKVGGSQRGGSRGGGSLTTSNADIALGSSTNRAGAEIRGNDFRDLALECKFAWRIAATGSASERSIDSDFMGLTLTYRELGDQAYIPLGGRPVGIDPYHPSDWWLLAPEKQDDATGYTVPRVLWRVHVEWDTSQERPVCTPEVIATGLDNVECAAFDDAGYLWVAGDINNGVGKSVHRINTSTLAVENMRLFADDGLTEAWGVVNLIGAGEHCIAELALESATVLQSWICTRPGVWSPVSARLTIDTLPLRTSGAPLDIHQHYRHRLFETVGGTGLSDSYQYHPVDFMLNPLVHLTGVAKEDGVLTVQTPLIDLLGPHEALKTILVAQCDSADVSASNTMRLRYRTSLDGTWTTWTTFTTTGARAVLSTPAKFNHIQFEIGLDRGATTTDTPNGLSFLIEGTSRWPVLRRTTVYIDPGDNAFRAKYGVDGFEKLVNNLQALQVSNPIQTLKTGADLSYPADWIDYATEYQGVESPSRGISPLGERHILVWDEAVGE